MVRETLEIALSVCLLAGCGSSMQTGSPPNPLFSEAQQCVRGGGYWRQNLGVCDMQGTGVEMMGPRH